MAELLPVIQNHKTEESNLIVRILWFLKYAFFFLQTCLFEWHVRATSSMAGLQSDSVFFSNL